MLKGIGKYILIFPSLVIFLLTGCNGNRSEEPQPEVTPQIIFLFSPGGLGDLSYNDCILRGVQNFRKDHPDVDIFLYSPPSLEVAERIFTDWLKRPGSNIPVLFTLASSDYEYFMDDYLLDYELTDNKRLLFFETSRVFDDPRIYTFQISMYGASYLAGSTAADIAKGERNLVILANSNDRTIQTAADGFIAGLDNASFDIEYLADDWTGYVMANVTYQRMNQWSRDYGFIFPVAGGSNNGIYRYTRENFDSPYLAGMDIDQSDLSTKITGSIIKRLDLLIDEYFCQWIQTGDMPESQIYGLESGYVDWLLSPLYKDDFASVYLEQFNSAILKEKEYLNLK